MNELQLKIQDLRTKNVQVLLEAITVTIVTLVINSMLPLLLVKYVYANKQLLTAPPIFNYINVGSFLVTVLYFTYAFVSNFGREKQIKTLMFEFESDELDEELSDTELEELEEIVDQALSKRKPKTKIKKLSRTTKKATRAKKGSKKTSRKK